MHKYTLIKDGLLLIGGLFVGYLTGKYVTRIKYEEIIENDMKHIMEYYEGKHPEKPKMDGSDAQVASMPEKHMMSEPYVKPKKVAYEKCYTYAVKTEDDAAESESPSEDDVVEYGGRDSAIGTSVTGRDKSIVIIGDGEFDELPTQKGIHLLYYTENDILTVTEGEGIEDIIYDNEIEDHIGDALTKFGFKTNSQDKICVRNYKNGCDYCIVKVRKAFGED